MLDEHTIQRKKELFGKRKAATLIEYHRKIGVQIPYQFNSCKGLPRDFYSQEFLKGLTPTEALAHNIQGPQNNLNSILLSIATPRALEEAAQASEFVQI